MVLRESSFRVIVLVLAGLGLYLFFPAVFGLLFVLFIPGFVSTYALFKEGEIDSMERIAFSLGLSISFVALTVMFSNIYLKIPVTRASVILQVSFLCVCFGLIIAARSSRVVMGVYAQAVDVLMLRTENPKRTLRFLAPGVIVLLLAVNIFYPLVFSMGKEVYEGEYVKYDSSEGSFEEVQGLKISRPHRIDFENGLVFIGYDISHPLKRGESAHVNYYFRSSEDMVVDGVTVVTDFCDDDTAFQNQFGFPSMTLLKGEIVLVSGEIMMPAEVATGGYEMHVSLFRGYSPVGTDDSNEVGMINIPWYFDELYNRSMDVQFFYNGRNATTGNAGISRSRFYVFDDRIAFLGYDMDVGVVSPGHDFRMTYWWRSLESVDVDYTVFVHFIDSRGRIVFQDDHALARPTSEWISGNVISEKYDVSVPYSVSEGIYRIRFGLYDAVTGERVDLSSRNVRGDAPYLGQITVRKKRLSDYYSGEDVRTLNTVDDTLLVGAVEVLNPVLVDYGQFVVLGYALDALQRGKTANLTYFVKSLGVGGNYSIRTVITSVSSSGVIGFDVSLPLMDDGEVAAIVVAVDVPLDYGAGESLFTFGLRDDDTGEYVRGGRVVSERVVVRG